MITIYDIVKQRYEKLKDEIKTLKSDISKLPPGKLLSKKAGKYFKWYQKEGRSKAYISTKNQQLIKEMAWKEYLECRLKDNLDECKVLEEYLDKCNESKLKINSFVINKPEFYKYILPYIEQEKSKLDEWSNQPYERNEKYSDDLINRVTSDLYVRSKSEVYIARMLQHYEIPFRYECELQLGEYKIYPDFTIKHPKSGRIYYWEHYGMIDKMDYFNKMQFKMELYALNKIYLGDNLITTYETEKKTLDIEWIEEIIKYHFL